MTESIRSTTTTFTHNCTFAPASPEIHQTIYQLFEEMATHSVWQLMTNASSLKNRGEQLRKEVHPFQMLIEIFADEKTHKHFQSMYEKKTEVLTGRNLVWSNFIQGVGENIENRKGEIEPYLDTFAKTMKINPFQVRSYLKNRDYDGLVSSITKNHLLQ